MNRRRVEFTATASHQVSLEHQWWRDNRDQRGLFEDELAAAVALLALLPGIGTVYEEGPVPGVRRLYLERLACHVYYTFDDERVIIRSMWGARRGRGPALDSSG